MKKFLRILIPMIVFSSLLVGACAGAAAPLSNSAGNKVQPAPVEFTGIIESIVGDQWVVNGQTLTFDPAFVRDSSFSVGDIVNLELDVRMDGSMVITRVKTSPVLDAAEAVNVPAPASDGLVLDDNGSEAFGTVDSMDESTVVIGGQAFQVANAAEFNDLITAGDFVKVHFTLNADGTMTITEIELSDPNVVGGDDSIENTNDDNGVDVGIDDQGSNSGQDDKGDGNDDSDSGSDDHGNSGGGDD